MKTIVNVWLEEMGGEERNGKEREGKKMRAKEDQSQFHCVV